MLKSLKTKNFRKLVDRQFTFTDGLNVIRGPNEEGKSTLFEAVKYALFGVKACREGLADMVTWGQPDSTLAVELVFEVEGVEYTVKRNKAGAELRYAGGHVTGQSEVGNFVARLFAVPLNAISSLMLASQNDIRGTVAGGDTDAAKLIETLANLKVLDDLLDLIKDRLPCGADVAPQTRLAASRTALAALVDPAEGVDTAQLTARAEALSAQAAEAGVAVARLTREVDSLNLQYAVFIDQKEKVEKHNTRGEELVNEVLRLHTQYRDTQALVPTCPSETEIAAAEQAVTDAANAASHKKVFEQMSALNGRPGGTDYTGTFDDFMRDMTAAENGKKEVADLLTRLRHQHQLLEQQIVTGSICGYCAKDVSSLPEVAEKNATISAQLADIAQMMTAATARKVELEAEVQAYGEIYKLDTASARFAASNSTLVEFAPEPVVPRPLHWLGSLPDAAGSTLSEAQAALKLIKDRQSAHHRVSGQAETYRKWHEDAMKCQAAHQALSVPVVDVTAMQATLSAIAETQAALAQAQRTEREAGAELITITRQLSDAHNAKKMLEYQRATLQEQIAAAEKEINELAFNNTLIKRVREVRPMVANHLWSKVLSAVSYYFSQMRGTQSLVTKTDEGFRVDGHSLKGMSGSTLDALGLAVRLALTKTFTPHVSMLVIDEPFAAMDEARTLASLGFIAGCNFKQILLVTHEEASTSNADNLITL